MKERIDLAHSNILVTGASGFIGGRLVDYLYYHYHANVKAFVRSYGHAVRLARLPIEMVPGDVTDPESLRRAVEGCQVVFHCAAGMVGEDQERYSTTVDGTRNMLQASLEAGVKRFIYLSTVAVHGPDPGPVIDENTPLIMSNDLYADSKVESEKLVSRFGSDNGLPVVILRPAIVYGPRSGSWTLGPLNNIRTGRLPLIEGGSGIANHVYVDDVVQAMLLAAVRPEAAGEEFLISHGTGATWKEFFGYYTKMLGIEMPNLTIEEIGSTLKQQEHLQNPFYMGLTFMASPHAHSIARQIPGVGSATGLVARAFPKVIKESILEQASTLREIKLHPPALPKPWIVEMYAAKGFCKIDKAQRLLGYQPQFSLEEGMRLTEAWLRHNRFIN